MSGNLLKRRRHTLKLAALTDEDRLVIKGLVAEGVFEEIDSHKLPDGSRDGTIIIACSDCDQCDHLFKSHRKACKCRRHQPLLTNGGALWLSPELTDDEAAAKRLSYVTDIRGTQKIKGLRTVALYVHAPCGAAANRTLSFWDLLYHVVRGKQHLKKGFHDAGVRFVCFCHVDFGGGEKRTFYFNVRKWNERQESLRALVEQGLAGARVQASQPTVVA